MLPLVSVFTTACSCSKKPPRCPLFSLAPRRPKYISSPLAPQVGKTNISLGQPSKKLEYQEHAPLFSLSPNYAEPLRPPSGALQGLQCQLMPVPSALQVRQDRTQSFGLPEKKSELWVSFPLFSFPPTPLGKRGARG